MLREAGIEVKVGLLEKEVRELNEIFIKYVTKKLPFVIMKCAMSLDGKIASYTGDSKWITGTKAREYVHTIRDRVSAIMVGINTVKIDNPYLTARVSGKETRDPVRVIVDSRGEIPLSSNVLSQKAGSYTIVATTDNMTKEKEKALVGKGAKVIRIGSREGRVDLTELMRELYKLEIDSVLLEGGSTLNASAVSEGIVDKVMFFIAPKIIGGAGAPGPVGGKGAENVKDALAVLGTSIKHFDDDILIEGYLQRG